MPFMMPPGNQAHEARMRIRIAHALAGHQAGAERVRAHHPFELPVRQVAVLRPAEHLRGFAPSSSA